jgi:hypothetical protein
MSQNIVFLQDWYLSKCDGAWEHSYGVEITNIDNPGWKVIIRGEESKAPKKIDLERSEIDWISVIATDTEFKGYGAPENLQELLALAIGWLKT